MSNLFLAIIITFVFLILIFHALIYKKALNRSTKKNSFRKLILTEKEEEYNPDINTKNWDLHKNRLTKFGRSQYKGLTFFISSEDEIYYFSKEGSKIYC
tara:strand:+ start:735 stop:1031 length:297 start_codon:yes stop_codon:yes gene_type:complete